MGKGNRWEEIYEDLREKIISGTFPAGSKFPTNLDLMREYNAHTVTLQTAVNALIRDGLVISKGKKSPRMVRTSKTRSKRGTGFSGDHGKKARKNVLELKMLTSPKDIPEEYRSELDRPTIYYHNEQFVDDTLLAVSRSYISNIPKIKELYKLLDRAGASLYGSLDYLGHKPTTCEESLIADIGTKTEKQELQLPSSSTIPVIRIIRKVYDPQDKLIELCFLICRADCYEFDYRFKFD